MPTVTQTRELEMNTDLRELNVAELEQVAGGLLGNWKTCDYGTTAGGGPGLYPGYADCNQPYTNADFVRDITRFGGTGGKGGAGPVPA
jgi:hypothetical protein